jgi:hypothetical protein
MHALHETALLLLALAEVISTSKVVGKQAQAPAKIVAIWMHLGMGASAARATLA